MKSSLKPTRDFTSFSPAKELKRSESEEAGLSKEAESSGSEPLEYWPEQQSLAETSQEDSEAHRESARAYEAHDPHHFRGSSFGNESETDDAPGSNFERLVTSYEKSLERQQTLDQQMKDLHQAHAAQQDIWESRYKRASLDLERLTQRNEELLELLAAKEEELTRLREDVETLRREARDSRAAESRTKEVIKKLEEELTVKAQSAKVEELVKYFTKERKAPRTPNRSPTPSQTRDGSPCFSLRSNSRFNGVYMLQGAVSATQRKEEDKGKQELRMPFLSHSTDNWISSLRSARSPARSTHTSRPKASNELSKESISEFTPKEGEELPNFAFFLNKF